MCVFLKAGGHFPSLLHTALASERSSSAYADDKRKMEVTEMPRVRVPPATAAVPE